MNILLHLQASYNYYSSSQRTIMSYLETQLTKRQEQIKEYQEMNSSLIKTFELISAEKEMYVTRFGSPAVGLIGK